MQFSIFGLFAFAAVAFAAPQATCNNGGFYYSDRKTLEPCKSNCVGGTCRLGNCPIETDPQFPLLCPATCSC